MATAVVSLEGVIRHPVGARLIPEGARLYQALCASGEVVLTTAENEERVRRWLDLEGLPQPNHLMAYMLGDDLGYIRGTLRYNVDLVVDADPNYVSIALEKGFNTLLFTHSEYAHPEWRPDRDDPMIPWTAMVERIDKDKITKANDARLKEEDTSE